jgi:PAS domain S-box-containing protein
LEKTNLPGRRQPKLLVKYAAAIALVGLALFLTLPLKKHFTEVMVSPLFFCAVILTAWYGGFGPGLLAGVLSAVAIESGLKSTTGGFEMGAGEVSRITVFLLATFLISWICGRQKRGGELLRQARDELEAKVRERTQDLQRVNEDLRRSETYLTEGQRLSHTGSFGWTVSTGEIFWSEETFRIFQWDPTTKPTAELVLQRVPAEDRVFVKQAIERAAQDGKDFDLQHRLVMPDGTLKHVRVVAHAEKGAARALEFVGVVMDVTEEKEAENKIRLIINTVPGMLWTARPDGWVDFLNERWLDYTGMASERGLGWGWEPAYHPDDLEQVKSKWLAAIAEGKPLDAEARLKRFDGEYRWFLKRAFPFFDSAGRVLAWYGSNIDIHDWKEAEEKLRASEAYLAEAQRLSHTGSWAWCPDTDGLRYWSEECFRVLGFDPHGGVPLREQFIQRIHPDDQARFAERLERAKREKANYDLEYRYILPSGEIRDIHTIGHPVLSPSGDLIEFVGTVIDDTERKRAEESLRKSEADLARVARATTLGELTASIAHEVNQPIAAVVTNANACLRWLRGESPNLEKAREASERIIRDGNRASDVIIRIRTLLKGGESEHKQIEINDVIREVVALAQGAVTLHRASLQMDLASELPPIWGDRVQLQQVLLNLVANALDAMETISNRPRIVRIRSDRNQTETVRVGVKDSGIGLNAQQMENLFNAFHTTKPEGLGMGLTISRSIIERHGGRLWAEANQGEPGALFQFTLPIMEGDGM